MAYQETTRQTYGSKVRNSFQGILWGIILIIAGTIVLWWNEGRAVKASGALKDFQKNYVELSDISTVDPQFEGKAVHATGEATTADTLRDVQFGIAVNALRLARDVQYYQYREHSSSEKKDKLGGATETTTTYTYKPEWTSSPVNSADFKDPEYQASNSVIKVIDEGSVDASDVNFGAYKLTSNIISSIGGEEPAYPQMTEALKNSLLTNVADSTVTVTVQGNQVYIGADPANPQIGDVRVTFTQVTAPKTISLMQKVVSNTFEPYVAKNGARFSRVDMGVVSAENMVDNQKSANKTILWLFRLLGVILVVAGFRSLLNFIGTVFAVVPFVQKIIGTGVGLVATVVGLIWSLVVIALAWIAHRTVLAIVLLVVAAALIVWLVGRSRKKKLNDVAALLMLVLALGLGACTKTQDNPKGSDTVQVSDPDSFKGPVKTILLTESYGEGEPFVKEYQFDEKGNKISEKELNFWDEEADDYGIQESLSEKDSQGRYTKEVWGSSKEVINTILYEYDDNGKLLRQASYDSKDDLNYENRYRYNDQGQCVMTTTRTNYGESVSTYGYDENGRQNHSVYKSNGRVTSINDQTFDNRGNIIYSRTEFPQENQINEYYSTFKGEEEEEEPIATRNYITKDGVKRLVSSDTTFIGTDGLKHKRNYFNYDDEHSYEGVFNKQGILTHYDFYEGRSTRPACTVDFNFAKDGRTLESYIAKKFEFGELKKEFSQTFGEYDTFGNWTERGLGMDYLPDIFYSGYDDMDNFVPVESRTITYYGEDQGQNYGFTGKVGQSDLALTWTNDHGVIFGQATIDGNPVRIVGVKEQEGLHIRALKEEGEIPWHLMVTGNGDTREGTFTKGMDSYPVKLTADRKNVKTYHFSTKPDEIVSIYQYKDVSGDSGEGTLDVSRCGEDWQMFKFEITNVGPAPSYSTANDSFTEDIGENTDFYQYLWDDDANAGFSYRIRFFDDFAVVERVNGSSMPFFGMVTVEGVYAKLHGVG